MDMTKCMALLHGLMSKRPAAALSTEDVARIYWAVKWVGEKSSGKIPLAAALKKEIDGVKELEIVSSLL